MEPKDVTAYLQRAGCSDIEQTRMWRRLERALASTDAPPRARLAAWCWRAATMVLLLGAGGAATIFGMISARNSDAPQPSELVAQTMTGKVTTTAGDRAEIVVLDDGGRVALSAHAQATFAATEHETIVHLLRGDASFQAARAHGSDRRPERRHFTVHVQRLALVVVGMRFRIDTLVDEGAATRITCEDGHVEVRGKGRSPMVLAAGETWTAATTAMAPAPGPATARKPLAAAVSSRPHTKRTSVIASTSLSKEEAAIEPEAYKAFERADRAWVQGRAAEAANMFDAVRRRYPNDATAPLAAFQLGRIRLDALADPRGAVEALQSARARAGDTLREDIDARLVEAFDRSGQTQNCLRARSRYLAAYPAGHHRDNVSQRCRQP